jgi:hypothetical protein
MMPLNTPIPNADSNEVLWTPLYYLHQIKMLNTVDRKYVWSKNKPQLTLSLHCALCASKGCYMRNPCKSSTVN